MHSKFVAVSERIETPSARIRKLDHGRNRTERYDRLHDVRHLLWILLIAAINTHNIAFAGHRCSSFFGYTLVGTRVQIGYGL